MSTINALPTKKGDQSIYPGDVGPAVKELQDFLQKLPEVQKYQEFQGDFGKGYSLLDSVHYGNFELDTRKHVRDYQEKNKKRIMQLSNLTESEVNSEITQGIVSYATVLVIYEDQGKKANEQKEEEKTAPEKKTESPDEYPIDDPAPAASTPEATFFVKTINPQHRLALRKAPAYVKVSKEASQDEDKKGKRVAMMPNGTLLKIIVPHVGFECLWHQVEVVDKDPTWNSVRELQKTQNLFCFAEFVQPLKKTKPLPAVQCSPCLELPSGSTRPEPFPDWPKLDECEPFHDKYTCKYYIVSDSRRESVIDIELNELRKEAKVDGLRSLLEFYDKQGGIELINRLVETPGFSTDEDKDFFLGDRPASTLKFLVGVSDKHFNAIPRSTEFFDGIPTLGGILPTGWRSARYTYKSIKEDIEIVAKRFEEYDEEVKKWEGEVQDLDFKEEAKRLRDFIPALDKFLKWNDVLIKKDESNSFEIGFSGPCMGLIYVLEQRDQTMVPLRIGLECFKRSYPVVFERTMGYVFYLGEMGKDVRKQKRRWISFIQDYSCPLPRIIPKDSGRTPQKAREFTERTVKNEPAKVREDDELKNPQKKQEQHVERRTTFDYVGDPLFSCEDVESVISRLHSLEDVYREVLSKVDIFSLSTFVTSCLASRFSLGELNQIACKSVLQKMPNDKLEKFLDYLPIEQFEGLQDKMRALQEDPKYSDLEDLTKIALRDLNSEVLCQALHKFDPDSIKLFIQKLTPPDVGAFKSTIKKKFRLPTISISDYLPTEDTMSFVKESLIAAVKGALTEILISMIKVILSAICQACVVKPSPSPSENYGDASIGNFFKPDVKPDSALKEAFKIFDIPPEAYGLDLDGFLNDLSSILTPSEICSLLRGSASVEVLGAIRGLIKNKYQTLAKYLSTNEHIREFFKYLSRHLDMSICEEIERRVGEIGGSPCEEVVDLRAKLLEGRMAKKDLDKQFAAIKEREAEILDRLVALADGDLVNSKTIEGKLNKPGCQNFSAFAPASLDHLNRETVNVMFEGLDLSFKTDIDEFREEIEKASSFGVKTQQQSTKDILRR